MHDKNISETALEACWNNLHHLNCCVALVVSSVPVFQLTVTCIQTVQHVDQISLGMMHHGGCSDCLVCTESNCSTDAPLSAEVTENNFRMYAAWEWSGMMQDMKLALQQYNYNLADNKSTTNLQYTN